MAFTIEGGKQGKMLSRIVVIIASILILMFATYYLFFTQPPQIEVLVPIELRKISQISEFNIDPAAVINSPEYKSLKQHVEPAQFGEFGRLNPFARF